MYIKKFENYTNEFGSQSFDISLNEIDRLYDVLDIFYLFFEENEINPVKKTESTTSLSLDLFISSEDIFNKISTGYYCMFSQHGQIDISIITTKKKFDVNLKSLTPKIKGMGFKYNSFSFGSCGPDYYRYYITIGRYF